jgi:hypothetical protein
MPRKDKTFHPADLYRIFHRHLDVGEQAEFLSLVLGGLGVSIDTVIPGSVVRAVLSPIVRRLVGKLLVFRYQGRELENILDFMTDVFIRLRNVESGVFLRSLSRRSRKVNSELDNIFTR